MPPRFDDEGLLLQLSVADLLERDSLGRIGFGNRGGYERLWVGQAIHSRYQERAMERDPTYQREVTLKLELEHRGWRIELMGRVDGLRRDPDGRQCVEEIKSVRPGTLLHPSTAEMYQRQAAIYAYMLTQLSGEPVRAELVLIEIGSLDDQGIERHDVDVDERALGAGIERRLSSLLRVRERQRQEREERREAAGRLAFPFHRPRPGQQQIIDATTIALEQREHLLIEAATGLGKTAATLFPVLRYALAHDKKVFVLTAKTTQQEMATQVLEMLNVESAFRSLRLRAKSRMCANDELICHEEYCRFAKDYFLKLQRSQLVERLVADQAHFEPDVVFEQARVQQVCPFEVSLELGRRAQVTVCDYNYAFEPYVALSDFSEECDLSDVILVVDEIHNLVDRGRGYYSPLLSASAARKVTESFPASGALAGAALESRMRALAFALAELIDETVRSTLPEHVSHGSVEGDLPEDELWQLRQEFDRAFVDYLEHRRETKTFRADDPFVDLYFALLRFLNTLELSRTTSDGSFSHCHQIEAGDRSLRILCKDAGRELGKAINRTHSTLGLSATLSPTEFYRDLLGFDAERTSALMVDNPFPRENRALVIDASVSTAYRQRERNYEPIADRLAEFADAVPGNCLALFPSYAFLKQIAERIDSGSKRIIVQRRADGEREREQILETLRTALFGDVLLLAVAGGVFAEGVDYPGDMLSAVAVVGPCLPAVSLEQKLLETYFEERYARGFEYASVIPGMTRVVQAAGRLIRSASDRGVIALFGQRFLSRLYAKHMPDDWLEGREPAELSGHPASVAASFFAQRRQAASDSEG